MLAAQPEQPRVPALRLGPLWKRQPLRRRLALPSRNPSPSPYEKAFRDHRGLGCRVKDCATQVVSEPAEDGEIVHTGESVDEWLTVVIKGRQGACGIVDARCTCAAIRDGSVVREHRAPPQ